MRQLKNYLYLSRLLFIVTIVCLCCFPSVILYGKLIYSRLNLHGSSKVFKSSLGGMDIRIEIPKASVESIINGKYQDQLSKWFAQNIGFRTFFIRMCNQIYYSIFRTSYMYSNNIIIGNDKQLYERIYIDEYCGRLQSPSDDEMELAVAEIAECQKLFADRGIQFMVLITPSKAYTYPEYIPSCFRCQPERDHQGYERVLALFAKHGVHVLDCQQTMLQAKAWSGVPLFPRGGTHWNQYGVYLAANAVAEYVENLLAVRLASLDMVSMTMVSPREMVFDLDLAWLLNLLWPPYDFKTPKLELIKNAPPNCVRPKATVVGGSFNWDLLAMLHKHQIFGQIDFFYYYSLKLHTYPEDTQRQTNFNAETIDWDREFLHSDLIILEVNEHVVVGAGHCSQFVAAALKHLRETDGR
jgi:alginate O-acetyltransferase complex protein AlgJ